MEKLEEKAVHLSKEKGGCQPEWFGKKSTAGEANLQRPPEGIAASVGLL